MKILKGMKLSRALTFFAFFICTQASLQALPSPAKQYQPLYAKVVEQRLVSRSGERGLWKGRVQGNGEVSLFLQFLDKASVKSTRYMGSIRLKNKSSSFSFSSPMPAGASNWKIIALARET